MSSLLSCAVLLAVDDQREGQHPARSGHPPERREVHARPDAQGANLPGEGEGTGEGMRRLAAGLCSLAPKEVLASTCKAAACRITAEADNTG